ncbi:MAG: 5'/3'-nucleotidase SurE [Deltaproteobacteria bacterium]|nr:5'/3'-nucleotidase SurE [Deltaproteobacteria bacterium]MBT4641662.1 5'/3'-nucleotidase SurE [Deltaproteobacteria bacterium]MBT6611734.1 5'/3'-nucleotidase SurE [Deltaproteobacteria bacterium]MBT7155646.1 5'/3'-nucleotidase SurE [Deltaproteobacteria bacterium]MBT7715119.1 5'/3'-nucleotidase SurE [Deltaproteobacteria bacterium]
MNRPRIFLSNDDGIESPGLLAAVKAVMDLGEIIVVAPSTQQTGMGRSLKGDDQSCLTPYDFGLQDYDIQGFHCNGTPAMAVHHGVLALCSDRKPDLLISGINYGENMGTGVTASGTVGAAMEGADLGIPAIAVSKQTAPGDYHECTKQDWQPTAYFVRQIAKIMLTGALPADVDLLKIDVPREATPDTPWRLTRLSKKRYWRTFLADPGPHSRIKDAEVTIQIDESSLDAQSDVYAVAVDKVVSVTPLSLDFTSRTSFENILKNLTSTREN